MHIKHNNFTLTVLKINCIYATNDFKCMSNYSVKEIIFRIIEHSVAVGVEMVLYIIHFIRARVVRREFILKQFSVAVDYAVRTIVIPVIPVIRIIGEQINAGIRIFRQFTFSMAVDKIRRARIREHKMSRLPCDEGFFYV